MFNSSKFKEIILTWENDIRKTPVFERELIPLLKSYLSKQIPMVLHGIRRSGKTYLMFMLFKECKDALYVNFEDERLSGITLSDLDDLYLNYLMIKEPERPVMFLDEIQNIKGWEKFVARLQSKVKFIISGSNASLLSSEYATVLTGRYIAFRVHPLSFKEVLGAKKIKSLNPSITEQKAVLLNHFYQFLDYGGFPDASLNRDPLLLKSYFEGILYRDILPRFTIQNNVALETLAHYLISNPGKLTSFRNLAKITGLQHEETVKNYLSYITKSYLVSVVHKFDFSIHKQVVNPKKIFPEDTGIVKQCGTLFSDETGRLTESVVYNEFIRKGYNVFYWKNERGKEVDFVICQGLQPVQLVQVCERIDNEQVLNREISALTSASAILGVEHNTLLTLHPSKFPVPGSIQNISLLDFLLDNDTFSKNR